MSVGQIAGALVLAGIAGAGTYGYGRYSTRKYEHLDLDDVDVPGSYVEIDGVRLHYVEAGQGEPVLLIHGLSGSTFAYRHVIPELAQHYRVVAFDLKGFGYSERPDESDYSLTEHARMTRQLMDTLGLERAAVVGHSMGGSIAMRLSAAHPERVSRLVLVSSVTNRERRRRGLLAGLVAALMPTFAAFTLHSRRFRERALLSAVHDPAFVTDDVREGYYRPTHIKGHMRSIAHLARGARSDAPLEPEQLTTPTLILWGEHDRWIPIEAGEELHEAIPNSELVLVPSAGHLALEEQPEFCNRELLRFLGAPSRPASGAELAAEPAT